MYSCTLDRVCVNGDMEKGGGGASASESMPFHFFCSPFPFLPEACLILLSD